MKTLVPRELACRPDVIDMGGDVPASEDTEPHRRETHDPGVAVVREVVGDVVLGVAATETDEVGRVTADDAEATRRWRCRLAPRKIKGWKKILQRPMKAMNRPMPAPTAMTSDCGMMRASHCRRPSKERKKNSQLASESRVSRTFGWRKLCKN